MMKLFLTIAAICAAPAFATSPDNATCAYPAAALAAKAEGTTLVGFMPMTDGTFRNARLRHSSGNADLDQAAVACVSGWRFDPKTDKTWVEYNGTFIKWTLDGQPQGKRSGRPHNCGWAYPAEARERKLTGTTALRFVITEDGHVRNAEVAGSSGSDALDTAALQCTKRWKYIPAVKNDNNVEARWYVEIPWMPDDALVTVERADQ